MKRRLPNFVRFSLIVLCTMGVFSHADGGPLDRFHFSVYGNAHSMNHDGVPVFSEWENPNGNLFQLRELSAFVDVDLVEGILASAELEVGNNASDLTVNYAYVDFDFPSLFDSWPEDSFGAVSLRAGKILVPFLSYNENKPNFRQHLMSQPFTASHLAPVVPSPPDFVGLGWSDVGLTVNWSRLAGDVGVLDVKYSLINGLGSPTNVLDGNTITLTAGTTTPTVRARDGLYQNEQSGFDDNNGDKAHVIKTSFASSSTPLDLGFSWYRGKWDPEGEKNLRMMGVHFNWLERNWTLKGEWGISDVEQDAGINLVTALGPAPINATTGDYRMRAFYVEGSVVPLRWKGDRYLRPVVRYDNVDTNDQAIFTPWDRSRMTYGAELQFIGNARIRYEFQRSTLDDFARAPEPFKMAGGQEHINMSMFSVIFWF